MAMVFVIMRGHMRAHDSSKAGAELGDWAFVGIVQLVNNSIELSLFWHLQSTLNLQFCVNVSTTLERRSTRRISCIVRMVSQL